jgi:hypothetical protein
MPAHRWRLFQAVTVVANGREGQQGGASWLWGTTRWHWPTQSSARPRICVPTGLAATCRLDDGTLCGQTVQFVGGARAGLSCGGRIVLCYLRRTILHHTELSCDAMPDCLAMLHQTVLRRRWIWVIPLVSCGTWIKKYVYPYVGMHVLDMGLGMGLVEFERRGL